MSAALAFKLAKSPLLWRTMGVLVVAAGIVGAFVLAYQKGVDAEWERLTAIHSAEISKMNQEAASAREQSAAKLAEAEKRTRDVERQWAEQVNNLEAQHYEEQQAMEAERDRLLASVRDGELRLRDRFTCTGTAANVPRTGRASGSSAVGDAAEAGGLQSEDVQFLIREAARADEIVRQLHACQGILRIERTKNKTPRQLDRP